MPVQPATDARFMNSALALAKRAIGRTNPNPMVGAVIVKNGEVIGRGYHHEAGSPHAEVEAIKAAGASLKGATLYVNLEPCSHYGRTPPCVDIIIGSGIGRVVCAVTDPNPKVAGRGIKQLRAAGLDVTVGTAAEKAKTLNEAFFAFQHNRRPFIALKFAASLDGKMATRTGDSKWITNQAARTYARGLRAEYQAVMVGVNTVLHDNPQLGVRQPGKKDPLRIIIDSSLRVPLDSQALRDNNVLIATTVQAPAGKKRLLEQRGVQVLEFSDKTVPLDELMSVLAKREIISVLVEGGGEILGSLIDASMADKVYAFYASVIIGGAKAVSIRGNGAETVKSAMRLKNTSLKRFRDNFLVSGYPET